MKGTAASCRYLYCSTVSHYLFPFCLNLEFSHCSSGAAMSETWTPLVEDGAFCAQLNNIPRKNNIILFKVYEGHLYVHAMIVSIQAYFTHFGIRKIPVMSQHLSQCIKFLLRLSKALKHKCERLDLRNSYAANNERRSMTQLECYVHTIYTILVRFRHALRAKIQQ